MDSALVNLILTDMNRKRASRLYYTNVGKASAYKCITKSFHYEHIVEFLAITLAQTRIWELILLTCQNKGQHSPAQPVSQCDLIALTLQMQRALELEGRKDFE